MGGPFERSTQLAVLSAGEKPSWTTFDAAADYTDSPDAADDGVYLEGAIKALVRVDMREDPTARTARVTIDTYDDAADYTITLNATACTVLAAAHATEAELFDALIAAINGSAQAGVLTANDEDDEGTTILIVGDINTHFSIAVSATGTGVLAAVADPSTAVVSLWATMAAAPGETAPSGWVHINDGDTTIDGRGFVERYDVAGFDRLYVQVAAMDGTGDGPEVTYAIPGAYVGRSVSMS